MKRIALILPYAACAALFVIGAGITAVSVLSLRDGGAGSAVIALSPTPASNIVAPPTWTTAPLFTGIIEDGNNPGSAINFRSQNEWQTNMAGNRVQVFAGSSGECSKDPGRGELLVRVTSAELDPIAELGGAHLAPFGTGPLRIVSFAGTVLSIESADSQVFQFDVETSAFTTADGNPVPTDTPGPVAGTCR